MRSCHWTGGGTGGERTNDHQVSSLSSTPASCAILVSVGCLPSSPGAHLPGTEVKLRVKRQVGGLLSLTSLSFLILGSSFC